MFLGTTDFKKLHQPGNTPGDDPSLQREQFANTFLRALGVPWLNRRYVAVYVNGNRRGHTHGRRAGAGQRPGQGTFSQ